MVLVHGEMFWEAVEDVEEDREGEQEPNEMNFGLHFWREKVDVFGSGPSLK